MVVERTVELVHETGLHLRPAGILAQLASTFQCDISIAKEGSNQEADAKSTLHLVTLDATKGVRLVIRAQGEDAEQAVQALVGLVEQNFRL